MASALGRRGDQNHPAYVAIPDPKTVEGLRAYREPDEPHPLQLTFLTEQGERAWVGALRDLLIAGHFADADAMLTAALDGFDGSTARLCRALPPEEVTIDGWEDLVPILAEFEGPAITAITIGLANEPDQVFERGQPIEPEVLLGLYSDDEYNFTAATRDALLDQCASDGPGWAGHEEDVEFYVVSAGLAELNTALIQHKHRNFLRDGRDGVTGRAPGGYVEYVLGCWVRTTRFLQAVERAAAHGGLPDGVRLIAGTIELNADLATVIEPAARVTLDRALVAPVAALTIKPWVAKEDPTAESPATGASLRQRLEQPATSDDTTPLQGPASVSDLPQDPAKPRGFFARLFGRRS